ncbi:RB1-inducible coiled-coil protein 1-like isoform X2 [Ostrea edulis]|uniref:RB1-inducible coiled-coil protein 1-like isoform X2 n=1 Tax=Ostrea edulis TaxID=37623 RepID=UPI0024AF944F|nr:RB1-inducible coiled-coil protein 1-like isoform X2 [Ostrea edulis]
MLFVFHVDTGTMMTFDMGLLAGSVANLQRVISQACRISEEKQVLLISGGESLDPSMQVHKYHSGTDTNPIYLFSKMAIEAANPPYPSVHYGIDVDIPSQVEGSLLLPPTFGTVVARSQLAIQIHEVDREEEEACEKLVHDQHLQQQGWAAVVANMEDITSALKNRSDVFSEAYTSYMLYREDYITTLSSVASSVDLLSKIPVLPCLLYPVEEVSLSNKNLFDWITTQDPKHSLHDMVHQCLKATEQLNQLILDNLMLEVEDTFKQVDNPCMKEVKGIEDRLYGLDQILNGARKIVQEQSDLAQALYQNQTRVSKLRDTSILPDLCNSHKKQLVVMVNNHKKLQETKKKCKMAKEELSVNLHTRLRWVMLVEKRICDVDGKLMIYHDNLKRLRKRLDILKQIHNAPQMYAKLVVEVVRRRKFSTQFLKWASHLAVESQHVHEDEVKRREAFQREVGNHFLQSLFNGLEDSPSSFATEKPKVFDQHLPPITPDDVTMLRNEVPELANDLQVPLDVSFLMKDVFFERSLFKFDEASGQKMATSDIEIIDNCDEETFLTTDQSLSLEHQVASSEMDPNLLLQIQKESCADKPELLMPRSLSEELTKQMRICSKDKIPSVASVDNFTKTYPRDSAIKFETDDSAKKSMCHVEATSESFGTSTSSGEHLKSTESELSEQEKTSESAPSGKKRVRRQTDQEMETSQEFTTADFYIEDSMPSSIADSPPSKGDKQKARPLLPEEEVKILEVRLQALTCELEESRGKLEKLVNLSQETLRLKSDLLDLHTCVKENKNVVSSEMTNTQTTLLKAITESLLSIQQNFDKAKRELEEEKEKCLEKEEIIAQFHEKETLFQKKLSENESEVSNLHNTIEGLKQNLIDLENEKVKEKETIEKEKEKLIEKHKNEIEEINKENSLELEVELDKLRSEFQEQISELENNVHEHEAVQAKLNEKITSLSTEKSREEEKLFSQFQQEKNDITKILQAEYEEKLKKEMLECRTSLDAKHKEETKAMQKLHNDALDTMIKDQKELLTKEKDDELEKLSEQLNSEFEKSYQVLKETIEEDHKKALIDFMSQSEQKYKEEKLHNEGIFEKQIDELQQKLNIFTEKKYYHKESQTTCKESAQQEVQTDILDTTQTAIQTDQWRGVEVKTQTETTLVMQREAQTSLSLTIGMEVDTQTEMAAVVQQEAQTNLSMQDGRERNTQTDNPVIVQQEIQTILCMNVEEMDTETQTEITEQIPQGIQTSLSLEKTCEVSEMETQTDSRQVIQQEIQTSYEVTNKGTEQNEEKVIQEKEIQTNAGDNETAISTQEHRNQMAFLEVRLTAEKDKALIEMKQKCERDISEIISKLEKEKSDSLTAIHNSLQAEKQVAFNAAVIKLAQEKDKVIENLRAKEKDMLEQQSSDQETILKLNEERSKLEDIKARAMSRLTDKDREFSAAKRQLEDELAMIRQQLSQYQSQLQVMSAVSVPSIMGISQTDELPRIVTLEDELKNKTEKIMELQQKLMEMSMTSSTRNIAEDKVSITSCNVGDLALFCLDDRHDQYVVFTIGSTLHFLHTDCQEILGLKPNPGETKKSWVLAEIIEKEYCQAKKPQNRFKVPVGTKFYRVKAKPWKPESGARGTAVANT